MTDEERGGKEEPRTADLKGNAAGCLFLLTSSPLFTPPCPQLPVEEPIVSTDEVIFPLTVSLDRLPPGTPKAKVRLARGGAVVLIQMLFLRLAGCPSF